MRHGRLVTAAGAFIGATPLGLLPTRVRAGRAKGARWTLLPFSSYWRSGESEHDVQRACEYLTDLSGITFWDIGAHFGIHSVGMAMSIGTAGQVVAFEPDPCAFRRLSRHVALNRLDNVQMLQVAASNKNGAAALFLPQRGGSSCSHLKFNSWDDMNGVASTTIETVRPDDLVRSSLIRAPDLIKIDVQGHGAQAIEGSLQAIRNKRPIIAFSNHSDHERFGIRDLLAPLAYTVRDLGGMPCDWNDIADVAILVPKYR
jgi:FkbM family methyltransferase